MVRNLMDSNTRVRCIGSDLMTVSGGPFYCLRVECTSARTRCVNSCSKTITQSVGSGEVVCTAASKWVESNIQTKEYKLVIYTTYT